MRLRPRAGSGAALVGVLALALLAGCGRPAGTATPTVTALRVDAPMHLAVWSDPAHALIGVTDGGRLEKLVSAGGASSLSPQRFTDIGDDVAPGLPGQPVLYLPQPGSGQVAIIDPTDLRQTGTLSAGPRPSYVSTDVGANVLLALSDSGDTVTGVSIRHGDVVTSQHLAAPADAVDGPERERLVEYHVTGESGIAHYEDGERRGSLTLPTHAAVTDGAKATRLYVAETGTDRLLAVDSRRSGDGLEVVGSADLGTPVLSVGVDATRIYALTADRLVVLETRTYGGYPDGRIPVARTIDLRAALPPSARGATLSGLAVGADRVYVTVAGAPYVLDVSKPSL